MPGKANGISTTRAFLTTAMLTTPGPFSSTSFTKSGNWACACVALVGAVGAASAANAPGVDTIKAAESAAGQGGNLEVFRHFLIHSCGRIRPPEGARPLGGRSFFVDGNNSSPNRPKQRNPSITGCASGVKFVTEAPPIPAAQALSGDEAPSVGKSMRKVVPRPSRPSSIVMRP